MEPSKSRRCSSTRSSILKTPKILPLPLSENLNSSSNESSPATTSKSKRRVSFAEKKHVKQFCDSVEQGTVWDNTYEEHDLSGSKQHGNSNHGDQKTEGVFKESIFPDDQENDPKLIHSIVTEKDLYREVVDTDCYGAVVQEIHSSSPVNLPSKGHRMSRSIVVYEDEDCRIPEKRRKISQPTDDNFPHNSADVTCVQDISMDLTEIIKCGTYRNENYVLPDKTDNILDKASINKGESLSLPQYIENTEMDVTNLEKSMEFTVALPSVIKCNSSDKPVSNTHCTDDETAKLNISMEMTAVVSKPICNLSPTVNESFQDNFTDTRIQDVSMQMTKPVETNIHVSRDRKMEIQRTVESRRNVEEEIALAEIEYCRPVDKTCIFEDESMKFTTAISVLPKTGQSNLQYDPNLTPDHPTNRTTIFDDNSMTFTKVIPPVNKNVDNEELSKSVILSNSCMDTTEVVPATEQSSPKMDLILDTNKLRESISLETINKDLSLKLQKLDDPSKNTDLIEEEEHCTLHKSSKTILHDSSMTLTKPLPVVHTNTNLEELSDSMEMTEVIPSTGSYPEEAQVAGNIEKDMPINISSQSIVSPDEKTSGENKLLESLENSNEEILSSNKIQDNTDVRLSSSLHDSKWQDTSALKENNAETMAFPNNENAELTDNDFPRQTFHSRRTYTIEQSKDDHFFAGCNEENDVSLIDKSTSEMLFRSKGEELESIDPPSFVYTNDLSKSESSSYLEFKEQSENNCLDDKATSNEKEKLSDKEGSSTIHETDSSLHEVIGQGHSDKTEDVSLSNEENANSDISILKRLSLTENNVDNCPLSSAENNLENLSEVKDLVTESSLIKCKMISEDIVRFEEQEKLKNADMMEIDNQSSSNQELETNDTFSVEDNVSLKLDGFSLLVNKLKTCSKSSDIIWEVYHENIERKILVIGFISCSLLIVFYLNEPDESSSALSLKEMKIVSRLADDVDALIQMVHRIIQEKLELKSLANTYNNSENILELLDEISKEIKLAMNFMFDLKSLCNTNPIEISHNRISFISRTKKMSVVAKVTIDIKPFDKIEAQDISVSCILGSLREENVKKLIRNVKRDHKFLRRYINDVRDYICLMEETNCPVK